MRNILLLTTNSGLKRELTSALLKGHTLVTEDRRPSGTSRGVACVFIALDTVDIGRIREHSGKAFVIAVTSEERTGPVMEAATAGAYEIIRRPLRKEQIARVLNELHELGKEMEHAIPISKDLIAPAATCVIVGRSTLVMSLVEKVARLAQIKLPLLFP